MKTLKVGIISAFIASLCCLGPLLLVLLGLGSLGIGAFLGKLHWYFLLLAIGIILYAWYGYFKEKKTCNLKGCQMENKKITFISLLVATIVISIFLFSNLYTFTVQREYKKEPHAAAAAEANTIIIPVEGMTCLTCEITIKLAVKKVKGVINVRASARKGEAEVVYDAKQTTIEDIVKAINKTGYKAELPTK